MSTRSLLAHVILSLIAVVFAWRIAHSEKEEERGATSTTILDVSEGAVTKVSYTWPKGNTTVERSGTLPVVVVDRELDKKKKDDKKDDKKDPKKKDAADAGPAEAPDAGVAEEPAAREQARFPGGKNVVTALSALEPLKSKRTLGSVDAARLKAMGLESPERTLTIESKKGTLVLELGESAYGGQGRYARVRGDATVHLIETSIVSGFEGGVDGLMEKRVLPIDPEDVVAFEVRFGDKSGTWLQLERAQDKARRFVKPTDEATAVESAQKVMNTLRGLRVTKLADAKQAASPLATIAIKIDKDGDARTEQVEIVERTDGAGHLARWGGWFGELSETQYKELAEDLDALWAD